MKITDLRSTILSVPFAPLEDKLAVLVRMSRRSQVSGCT